MMKRTGLFLSVWVALFAPGALCADEMVDHDDRDGAPVERPEAAERRVWSDQMRLETTAIRGNQELPRVMYIVPWKDPALGDVTGKPVNSLIDEVLAPLDRDVFLRQTNYFDQLYGTQEAEVSD
jgi:hypothetical protein